MSDRTNDYLHGRFCDHYRRSTVSLPPAASDREWAFIPWTSDHGTTMVRHRSLMDFGDLSDFLARRGPQHVFFSAGRYAKPSAGSMGQKEWSGADLIFDLDADHLPGVTLGEDTYGEMLETCKSALYRLLDFLETDFAYSEIEIVFSGGRGYHVHVRDTGVQRLEREHRREIVDYVRGIGLEFDDLVESVPVSGMGRSTPAKRRALRTGGGWGRRVHTHLMDYLDDVREMEESAAIESLQQFDGFGERKAEATIRALSDNYEEIERGNISVHTAISQLAERFVDRTVKRDNAPIDEPVTTDMHRLIRLPGSLHGGSALEVCRIDREDLSSFDPLVDAIPETFVGHSVKIEVTQSTLVELGEESTEYSTGVVSVPEYVAMFLMARGAAEKVKE